MKEDSTDQADPAILGFRAALIVDQDSEGTQQDVCND
jgi:hypothetical protein